ncbi:MAG: hypothetical protein IKS31_03310 [Clostridia bacterium]|nr:hypothetical protein [Clostridia bacterium]MBR4457969.1 hypothetical protein [Clostridia bacterium]
MNVITTSLVSVLLAVLQLLFATPNVTLQGTAEFRLEGTRFKGVEARYVQDGGDSFWDLKLSTPRKDGTERETGYLIICNEIDEHEAHVCVMDRYKPGFYRELTEGYSQPSLVTPTVTMQQLAGLAAQLMPVIEAGLPEGAVTVSDAENGGETVHLVLTADDVTPLMNAALNTVALPVAEHIFREDHGIAFDTYWGPAIDIMDFHTTVTDGLLSCVTGLRLAAADLTFTLDGEGRITGAEGTLGIDVDTDSDGTLRLDIDIAGTISDYGDSHVDTFDPAVYNVLPFT